jgi:hypothetical protein
MLAEFAAPLSDGVTQQTIRMDKLKTQAFECRRPRRPKLVIRRIPNCYHTGEKSPFFFWALRLIFIGH